MPWREPTTWQDRFWSKVERRGPEDCWLWTAATISEGYGQMSVAGKSRRAHRISFELANGPISNGLWVLHRCDNPPCCNPAHLFLGTNADNVRDACNKGRQARGERSGAARLTADNVREIRSLISEGVTQRSVGRRFGVTTENISAICRGLTWRHVS